ncbi:porin [Shinella daejeonensis]|uniref:porin n=1 Tax=Shinella daejeonensis TaxID=659017 RepID=UPI0020C7EE93|nr:porin [Shinella daejeonensis]MCP8895767.1 porin [Shinella daejeonensis]
MNIKSLLIGSAAALAVVSGAQAADAIVAAEPEPMEYVRVCDAFGTGFFYIPGTETCLRIGGYVRTQLEYSDNPGSNDWSTLARARVFFDAREDTEYGTLRSFIAMQIDASGANGGSAYLDEAYIDIAGLRVGYMLNWWDDGFAGETDSYFNSIGGPDTNNVAIRYWYDGGQFGAGVAVETLADSVGTSSGSDNVGINGKVQFAFGPATFDVIGSYDTAYEEGTIQARIIAELGPGSLQAGIIYNSGYSNYSAQSVLFNDAYEWQAVVAYEANVTDRFTITPAFQYDWDHNITGDDDWTVGVTAGYQVTDNLSTLATVNYNDSRDSVGGFLRLQRDF